MRYKNTAAGGAPSKLLNMAWWVFFFKEITAGIPFDHFISDLFSIN